MGDTEYTVKNFEGAVLLKHWMRLPDGTQATALVGNVSILSDKELVGFAVSGQESNWAARIAGPTQSFNILGCQIIGAIAGPISPSSHDYYRVP